MNKNYWPEIDDVPELGACVFKFVKELNEQLKAKYNGVISCSLIKKEYTSFGCKGLTKSLESISQLVGPQESKSKIEEARKEVDLPPLNEYKFLIYNKIYFFRVFDIKLGAYFPIEIKPADGIEKNQDPDYIEVRTVEQFEDMVASYLSDPYIRDIIRYMVNSDK